MKKAFLGFLFTACFSLFAGAETVKVSHFVTEQLQKSNNVEILVFLKPKANLKDAYLFTNREDRVSYVYNQLKKVAVTSQRPIIDYLQSKNIGYKSFYIDNVIFIEQANETLVQWLAQHNDVKQITLNAQIQFETVSMDTPHSTEEAEDVPSHLQMINAHRVWEELGVRGEGIVVGGQDTGYLWDHEAIKNQYRGYSLLKTDHNYNWHDAIHSTKQSRCPANQTTPCDDKGHGTHTMGTIVGDDGNGNNIGVAPAAKWMGCRNMDVGVGTPATYLECFQFFLAPFPVGGDPMESGRPDLAPHIINNSWSCPTSEGCNGDEFINAVRALRAAGIAVVAAAGNEGSRCGSVENAPGMYSGELFTVAAWNRWQNKIASFSSRGPSPWNGGVGPNLTAPGTLIRSAVNTGRDRYDDKAGTSMAAPHVAGTIALLWSAKPELIGQVELTMEILQQTAQVKTARQNCGSFQGGHTPNAVYGYGMIDAYAAIMFDDY